MDQEQFIVRDCALITRMGGAETAMNLRELRERVAVCTEESLFHHFCEVVLRPSFDHPDYRNDFAVWAERYLRDRILAERLGIINPYDYTSMADLRSIVLDIIDERLYEVAYIPWAHRGDEFMFLQAVTVVFETGVRLNTFEDFVREMPALSRGSVYYHFVESRRRTAERSDDFTKWLATFGSTHRPLIDELRTLDFYYLTLAELHEALTQLVTRYAAEAHHA